jgi:hypothetical protein
VTRRAADSLKRAAAAGGYDGPQLSLLAYDSEPFAHGAGDGLGGASAAAPEASQVALDHADARSQAAREVMDRLRELDVSSLTPLDALNRLAQWQQSLS